MREAKNPPADSEDAQLDGVESRILNILDLAEGQAVRAINHTMVVAHWLIGRELFALQGGEPRAGYGTRFLEKLSRRLSQKGKRGYSVTNLRYFRLFYKIFPNRLPEIHHMQSDVFLPLPTSDAELQIHHLQSDELTQAAIPEPKGFYATLSWTHYRALASVEERAERLFYEIEAVQAGWSTEELTRAIDTRLFLRLLKSSDKKGVLELATQGNKVAQPLDVISDSLVLDFLKLPQMHQMRESDFETAIINQLQDFILELGKGFAFVSRQ